MSELRLKVADHSLPLADVRAVFPRPASVVRERLAACRAVGRHLERRVSPPPVLGNHVGHVLGVCAEEQMVRPTARRIVAAVADLHAVRDRTVGQFPGETVGPDRRLWAESHIAVSADGGSRPRPAAVRVAAIYPVPEGRKEPTPRPGSLVSAWPGAVPSASPADQVWPCGEGDSALETGTLSLHQAYSWCHASGRRKRCRGFFVPNYTPLKGGEKWRECDG